MRTTILATLILLAGCGSPDDAGAPEPVVTPDAGTVSRSQFDLTQSGTRLKARIGVTPDGAKMFLGWRDSQRGENCAFWSAADGKTRCLPSGTLTSFTQYRDRICSIPVTDLSPSMPCQNSLPPKYALVTSGSSCSEQSSGFSVRPVLEEVVGDRYQLNNGSCEKVTTTLPGARYFALGEEISAGEFVALTEQIEE